MEDKILQAIAELKTEIKTEIAELKEDMATKSEMRALFENSFHDIKKLLEEDYEPVAEKVRRTARKVADYDEMKEDFDYFKRALTNHNKRITNLEEERKAGNE